MGAYAERQKIASLKRLIHHQAIALSSSVSFSMKVMRGSNMRFHALLVGFCLALSIVPLRAGATDDQRQAEVAKRGAQVMPFSLNATTHVFTKTATGGIQQVVTKNHDDTGQVRLIREHLNEIANRFSKGDFSAPTAIHGPQMPGLAELKNAKPGEVSIQYQDLTAGGQIEYSTSNSALVTALHNWLDAQLSDHGSDAMEGHEHHHEH